MKKSKIMLYIFSAFIVIGLVGCGGSEVDKEEEIENENATINEVESSYVFTKDSGILVTLINPVNEIVNIEVIITYYDANDEEINKEESTIVSVHNLAKVNTKFSNIPDNANSFVIESIYEVSDIEESYANILDVLTTDNGREVTITVNNYEANSIENTSIGLLFYDGDNVVAYSEYTFNDIIAQNSQSMVASYPADKNGNIIYFDRVVSVVNNSYNSK